MCETKDTKSTTEDKSQTSGSNPQCCDFEKIPQMMKEFMGSGEKMPDCKEMMEKMGCNPQEMMQIMNCSGSEKDSEK